MLPYKCLPLLLNREFKVLLHVPPQSASNLHLRTEWVPDPFCPPNRTSPVAMIQFGGDGDGTCKRAFKEVVL